MLVNKIMINTYFRKSKYSLESVDNEDQFDLPELDDFVIGYLIKINLWPMNSRLSVLINER